MKVKLNKHIRLTIIALLSLGACFMLFKLVEAFRSPELVEENVPLYSYDQQANINYKVNLKSNPIYEEKTLGENQVYIENFVNDINAQFTYEFSGEEKSDINGTYEVIAVVAGSVEGGEEKSPLWSRQYTLKPKTEFSTSDQQLSVKENMTIDLNQYKKFASQVQEQSKVNADTSLKIMWRVNTEGENGKINSQLSPAMIIPLNEQYFKVGGTLTQNQPGTVEESKKVENQMRSSDIKKFGTGTGVFLVFLILFLLYTRSQKEIDPIKKELKGIFKKHGNRLVALDEETTPVIGNFSHVKTFEDLVRIADEIGQPILYIKFNKSYYQFFVSHTNHKSFMYRLEEGGQVDVEDEVRKLG
ncbi:DUF5305 family protein [Rossellomorea sp. DUT-2]|uniref:DUF5305 family protein n=1 Tax=Rossellomorea sp. DUT-2 TaxID=3412021 RepID=UPI003D1767AD